jgi:hypothetical protein
MQDMNDSDSYYYFNGEYVKLKDGKFDFVRHFSSKLKQPVSKINHSIKDFIKKANEDLFKLPPRPIIKESADETRKIIKKLAFLNKPKDKTLEVTSAYLSKLGDEFVIGIGYSQKA